MLRRGLLTAFAGAMLTVLGGALPAHADGPVECPPGQQPDPVSGVCTIIIVTPPGGGGGGGNGGGGGGGGGGAPQCVSQITSRVMPCRDGDAWWSNARNCYVDVVKPQPPASDPDWRGHTDGAIYGCYNPDIVGTRYYQFWSLTPPPGPAAPPDPRVLAQRAITLMQLRAVTVGIVPEPRPGSVGLVGMPNWMWAANPSATTWGPITRSTSAGGFTVTATGRVSSVRWDMGDGQVVVCQGPGTPYLDSYGRRSSPTCGHTYTRQGRYTVRATSHWVISWAGIGQSGTIPLDLTNTVNLTIGEVQVLTQ